MAGRPALRALAYDAARNGSLVMHGATPDHLPATSLHAAESAKQEDVAVLYEHRAAPGELKRGEVIDAMVEPVPRPPHKVNLSKPTQMLSCQVSAALHVFADAPETMPRALHLHSVLLHCQRHTCCTERCVQT